MLDGLLEKGLIELPEPSTQKKTGRTTDPKYYWFHGVISYPLEKCITLKEHIIQLARNGRIIIDLVEKAEANHTSILCEQHAPSC